jgi:hypothetical protein
VLVHSTLTDMAKQPWIYVPWSICVAASHLLQLGWLDPHMTRVSSIIVESNRWISHIHHKVRILICPVCALRPCSTLIIFFTYYRGVGWVVIKEFKLSYRAGTFKLRGWGKSGRGGTKCCAVVVRTHWGSTTLWASYGPLYGLGPKPDRRVPTWRLGMHPWRAVIARRGRAMRTSAQ